jgi:hypothetical protein
MDRRVKPGDDGERWCRARRYLLADDDGVGVVFAYSAAAISPVPAVGPAGEAALRARGSICRR